MQNRMVDMFGLEFPIFAFSHCRDVVAAVTNAGGMGVLGAPYFTPEERELELQWLDDHCDGKPYGVDIVMPMSSAAKNLESVDIDLDNLEEEREKMIPQEHRDFVERLLDEHHVPPLPADAPPVKKLIGWTDTGARNHVEATPSGRERSPASRRGSCARRGPRHGMTPPTPTRCRCRCSSCSKPRRATGSREPAPPSSRSHRSARSWVG
jgi:hypothetical protein